jgi:hypothetical protein
MQKLKSVLLFSCSIVLAGMGCQSEDLPISKKKCVRATVIYQGCAGLTFVQVHNANIGDPFMFGGITFTNVAAVNLPKSIATDSTVSFTLEKKSNSFEDVCNQEFRACNSNILPPKAIYCITNVNAGKCDPADEK